MGERTEKRKLRKGKLALTILSIVVLIAVIVAIVVFVKNKGKDKSELGDKGQTEVYELPDATYSDMKVTGIEMEYLKNNNETMVTMTVNNSTENTVEKESFKAILLDKDGNTLGDTMTYIDHLVPGEQCSISVIFKGDLTATTQIRLQK